MSRLKLPPFTLTDVSTRFGGMVAIEKDAFAASTHSIHAILGEKGAGKSKLIKVIWGVIRPDSGRMTLDGNGYAITHC